MMLAIYWFDRKQYLASSVLLGISISTKFLPIFLLIPIVFIFWREAKMKEAIKYLAITFGIWCALNLPFAVTTPTGWWRFYKLNLDRGPDWGSFWLALQQLGINLTNLQLSFNSAATDRSNNNCDFVIRTEVHTFTCISCIFCNCIRHACQQGVFTAIYFVANSISCHCVNKHKRFACILALANN